MYWYFGAKFGKLSGTINVGLLMGSDDEKLVLLWICFKCS